jgi:hypothetical protein
LVAVVSLAEQNESGVQCALARRGIGESRAAVRSTVSRVADAWRKLARVRVGEPQGITSAMTVLLDTVPLGHDGSGRRLPLPASPRMIRTAAHPRGWIGPKPQRPKPTDLREHLCGPGAWPSLRLVLRRERERVFPLLCEVGYDLGGLDALLDARDPYVAYHHRAPAEPGLAILPCTFRTTILPLLRSRPWNEVRQGLSLYWSLDLEHDPVLLALIVRLLALAPLHGFAWWALVPGQLPERRSTMVRILLDSDAHRTDPNLLPVGSLEPFARLEMARYEDRLTHLFAGLRGGVPPGHILQGFELADAHAPDHNFVRRWWSKPHEVALPRRRVRPEIEARLRLVLAHIADAVRSDGSTGFPIVLWEACAEMPALAGLLARPCLLAWPGETTLRYLRLLAYDAKSELSTAERAEAVERLLALIPASHHGKAIDAVEELFDRWPRRSEFLARFSTACAFLARLARPPFGKQSGCGRTVAQLVEAAGPGTVARLLNAPDRSLARLEHALRSDNEAQLLHGGLDALILGMGRFVTEAFIAHPEALFGAARLLGCLSAPRRLRALKQFRSNPVLQRRFFGLPLAQMCAAIEALGGPGMPNPIPRKLRLHLEGVMTLSPGSVERHRQAVVRRLLPFKLALLRRAILEDLGRGLSAVDFENSRERHALQMLGSVRTNRRLLRRLLTVPPSARRRFLAEHPANRAWLRRHSAVDPEIWSEGVVHSREVPDIGRVHLAIETDPLEVLRLGTEVGSCLAVGGACEDSAVAVTVDVNKQVVFARRGDGTFIARQLVAISEDDRLVFFPVYPPAASKAVKDSFYEYDVSLAAALGLAPFRGPSEKEYAIERVLAWYFYDDGLWDRFVDGEGLECAD